MNDLLDKVREGRFRAIARVISQIENNPAAARSAAAALYPHTGQAHVIGVTGPPGSGKSTLVNEVARQLAVGGTRVAIIAVDPSSPFSGGALLGDRVRMQDLASYGNIFIRSMASRGNLGGLARATAAAITVFDAAEFGAIVVETVGAGQAEVEIADAAHTTVVIETPGMGDEVQTIKAGILEIADILVVNKADRVGADHTVKALEMMLQMGHNDALVEVNRTERAPETEAAEAGPWRVPVLATIAKEGKGISEVVEYIRAHYAYLQASGEWIEKEKKRSRKEVDALLQERFMARFLEAIPKGLREQYVMAIVNREIDPFTAVDKLAEAFDM